MVRSNKYKKKNWRHKLTVFKLNAAFAVLWLVVCAMYLAVLNDMTANGYKIKRVENRLAKVEAENKDLNLNLSGKQSMERIIAETKNIGMTDSGSVTYLEMPSTAVVKR